MGHKITKSEIWNKKKAKTLFQVFKSKHGKIAPIEAHHIDYPGQTDKSHKMNASRDYGGPVMEEFGKLIRVDEKAMSQISNKKVFKEILEDLNRLNLFLEDGDCDADETCRLIITKAMLEKMLGSFLGMNKAPEQKERDLAEEVLIKLRGRFHGSEN